MNQFVKFVVVALLVNGSAVAYGQLISAGQTFTCAYDGRSSSKPVCWGKNGHGELDAPSITNLVQMESGPWHTCAIHRRASGVNAVTCWGDDTFRQVSSEFEQTITQPLVLSVARWHQCAIHEPRRNETRVVCWGGDGDYYLTRVPDNLVNPDAVYAGDDYNCVRHDRGRVRCWGSIDAEYERGEFPGLQQGVGMACAAKSRSNVNCWTNFSGRSRADYRVVKRMQQCELKQSVLSCSNSDDRWLQHTFRAPAVLAVGDWHVCVLDTGKVECFGKMCGPECAVPNKNLVFGPSFVEYKDAGSFLKHAAEFVYRFDAEFLLEADNIAAENGELGQEFVINALRSYFAGLGYRALQKEFIEQALGNLNVLNRRDGVDGITDFPGTTDGRIMAIRLLASSLRTSRAVISSEHRQAADRAIGKLGHAMAGDAHIDEDLGAELKDLFTDLLLNPYLSSRMDTNIQLLLYLGAIR